MRVVDTRIDRTIFYRHESGDAKEEKGEGGAYRRMSYTDIEMAHSGRTPSLSFSPRGGGGGVPEAKKDSIVRSIRPNNAGDTDSVHQAYHARCQELQAEANVVPGAALRLRQVGLEVAQKANDR